MNTEALIPVVGVITDIRIDTPDIKTFRVVTPDGKKAFDHKPGQCAMLSIPGVGGLTLNAINARDYPIFMLTTVFYTAIGLAAGLVVDISYGFIDPRIRMGSKK